MDKDKMKERASSFFKRTKTEIARTKQKAMQKIGKAEQTVDIAHSQELQLFKAHHKNIKKINADAKRLLDILRELCAAQNTLGEDFYAIYDTSADLYNAALKNQDVQKQVDNSRLALEEQWKEDFIEPVNKYILEFKEIKQRMKLESTRKVDMDRYTRDVKSHQEKSNKIRLQAAEAKLEAAKTNYTNLHNELDQDIPKLYEDRIPFFNPAFATYVSAMAEFYRQSGKSTGDVVVFVQHVNRSSVLNHPRVITPIEKSAAAHKGAVLSSENRSRSSTDSSVTTASAPPEEREVTVKVAPKESPKPTKKMPVPPPKPSAMFPKARAMFDFNPAEDNELGFKIGDIITIVKQAGDWWEGELNGNRGLLPSNYVQLIN